MVNKHPTPRDPSDLCAALFGDGVPGAVAAKVFALRHTRGKKWFHKLQAAQHEVTTDAISDEVDRVFGMHDTLVETARTKRCKRFDDRRVVCASGTSSNSFMTLTGLKKWVMATSA